VLITKIERLFGRLTEEPFALPIADLLKIKNQNPKIKGQKSRIENETQSAIGNRQSAMFCNSFSSWSIKTHGRVQTVVAFWRCDGY
jgi:hypothetical protein